MKKIIFTLMILILSINISYAEECSIANETSSALLEYIENNRKIVSEITSQTSKKSSNTDYSDVENGIIDFYSDTKSNVVQIYNEIFSYDGYNSYFKYYVVYPISNEVPSEIKRDYSLLESENDGLKQYLDTVITNNKSDIEIVSICDIVDDNVKSNCNYKDSITNTELIGELISNNESILNFFRNTVIGEENGTNYNFEIVSNNFESDISSNYSISGYSSCSENGGFFETISESISNIGTLNKEAKDGIQEWKDARALLLGKDSSNEDYQKLEKELLKEELSKQGISGDNQTSMLNALSEFNKNGFSENNNFLYNTYNSIKVSLESQFKEFNEEIIGDFFEEKTSTAISIDNINTVTSNSETTQYIKKRIETLYETQSSYDGISKMNTDNTRNRILNAYREISNSINTLNSTCEISVSVCKAQDSEKGNCGKCN